MSKGHDRERTLKRQLEDEDWWVARAAGSLGDADLVALKVGYIPRIIEVKANRSGGPYMNFRKRERGDLKAAAQMAGALAELCYWPPHKQPRFIPADEWPA
jgi:Holliday junction resolvase